MLVTSLFTCPHPYPELLKEVKIQYFTWAIQAENKYKDSCKQQERAVKAQEQFLCISALKFTYKCGTCIALDKMGINIPVLHVKYKDSLWNPEPAEVTDIFFSFSSVKSGLHQKAASSADGS